MSDADETPLIPEQRRELIVKHLRRESVMSYHQLTALLGVSQMTIRRDIAALEAAGRVLATPGGAKISSRLSVEPSRLEKATLDLIEKDAMAREASRLVRDGMTVFLDAGTTIQAMRPYLDSIADLTVVSNDLAVIGSFLDHPTVDLIALGGRVEKGNQSTVGRLAAMTLRELSVDVAFLSSSSWDLQRGVTTPAESKVDLKKAALAMSSEAVLVAGSSKYGSFGRYRIFGIDEVDLVISDAGLGEAAAASIRDLGTSVVLAEPAEDRAAG
ncbi:DeoR/GlpR family DNA-binding transcription regulator [Herbiconiux moechotypicola]|uniref:DeoR/GlpR family DNA-binding transcription regulator n=1 Tax=Herbiconiux moechotypicola TaxID=637393 RepID=A0ABN3D8M7_9MICO|nr:DeoR/GlpR family DNA-binding transcription regulator [Herbiconiux moechotypicola]MCS5728215.1 DeoR/GlpR family DNA-binding transcription regulator [Herbiconiux moechotypicola]